MKFDETKPRKAKYGFKIGVRLDTILEMGEFIKQVFGDKGQGDGWWAEAPNAYGHMSFLVYIDDDELYEKFKAVNDAN